MIQSPSDIARLPWQGNFAADQHLFEAIDAYIAREPDLRKRQEADQAASIYGMGEHCEIDSNYDPRR